MTFYDFHCQMFTFSILSLLIELSFLGIELYNTFTGYREKINTVFLDQNSSSVYRRDSILRIVLNPNVKVKISKSYSDGEIAYENLLFSTDEKGRRISRLSFRLSSRLSRQSNRLCRLSGRLR